MHTTQINKTTFIHNGGFDGDVQMRRPADNIEGGQAFLVVPFEDLKWFVANYIRQEKINHLESCSDDEILFQQVKK